MTNPQDQALLHIRNLQVKIEAHEIIKSASLDVRPGELVVLMGANGSGKSTLGLALAGHPTYEVTAGEALLNGQNLLEMEVHERAQAGLFMSFQSPPDIPGVKNNLFIRTAINAVRHARGEPLQDAFDFLKDAKATSTELGMGAAMLNRAVNEGFSGGERKRNELLQLAMLRPQLVILDEIDSGLDVDGVRVVVNLVKRMREQGSAFIVISHYLHMIELLEPSVVLRLDDGEIAEKGDIDLARQIAKTGFARTAEAVEA